MTDFIPPPPRNGVLRGTTYYEKIGGPPRQNISEIYCPSWINYS